MNFRLEKKQVYVLAGSILLLALLLTGLYFWLLAPMKTEIDTKNASLQSEQQYLDALQLKGTSANSTKEVDFETTVELQKKLPVKPLVEQLLLDLEKAEVVSGSFITTMGFAQEEIKEEEAPVPEEGSEDGAAAEGSEAPAENTDNAATETAAETDVAKEDAEAAAEAAALAAMKEEVLPPGVQKVTMTLTVQAPTYFEMENFIKSLQSMKRILKVDTITFTGSEEVTSIEQSLEPTTYNLTVSAFYYPKLTTLQSQLPQVDAPEPSKKINPFSNAPAIEKDTESENE